MAQGRGRKHREQQAEQASESAVEATQRQPGDEPPEAAAPRRSFREQVKKQLPADLTIPLGNGVTIHRDRWAQHGVGVRVQFPDNRKPTEDEKAIIKKHLATDEGESLGYHWGRPEHLRNDFSVPMSWYKSFGNEPSGSKKVAIDFESDGIANAIADELRGYYASRAGHAAAVESEGPGAERTPF